jgi:NAD(P)-dependent dehydrogenase (short-subunit alcohol dehydrogenase family)
MDRRNDQPGQANGAGSPASASATAAAVLAGKVTVITGGAGALGSRVVEVFREAGAAVVVVDREAALASRRATDRVLPLAVDLLDEASVAQAVDAIVARFGRIDALVCLAGGFFGDVPVVDTAPARLREQLELNLLSVYICVHAVLPRMIAAGGGAVVGVGSRPAVRPVPGAVAYGVAKLGVLKLMEAVAEEYREQGIRANAILPSIIDTPANRRSMPDADATRWVRPEQIAAVLRFLVSDDAAIISGAAIPVYGRA